MVFGMDTFEPEISAVLDIKADVLMYSRFQHDFFGTPDVKVDGGQEYMRVVGDPENLAVVSYNLLSKTYHYNGRIHHVHS